MGKVLLGIGLTVAACAGGAVAGYEYGQRHPDLSDKSTIEIQTLQGQRVAKMCGNVAIKEAKKLYVGVKNDPSTPQDESFDANTKAKTEAQPFVDKAFADCMNENFYGPSAEFKAEPPTFKVPNTEGK